MESRMRPFLSRTNCTLGWTLVEWLLAIGFSEDETHGSLDHGRNSGSQRTQRRPEATDGPGRGRLSGQSGLDAHGPGQRAYVRPGEGGLLWHAHTDHPTGAGLVARGATDSDCALG